VFPQGLGTDGACHRASRVSSLRWLRCGPELHRDHAPSAGAIYGRYPARRSRLRATPCSTSPSAEIEGNWWTLFVPDAIDQPSNRAVEHNRSLAASKRRLHRPRNSLWRKRAHGYRKWTHAGVGRQQYGNEFLGAFGKIPPYVLRGRAHRQLHPRSIPAVSRAAWNSSTRWPRSRRHQLDAAYLTVTGQAVMERSRSRSARAQIATVKPSSPGTAKSALVQTRSIMDRGTRDV